MKAERSPTELMRGRRRRARDWVRKGGLLYFSILSTFAVIGIAFWALARLDPGFRSSQWTGRTWFEIALLALLTLSYAFVALRWIMPWTISPARFELVSMAASDWHLLSAPPETLVFNRRLVAGQVGDGHRGIARWDGSADAVPRILAIHGVSKHSVPPDKVGARIRLGEIPHVLIQGAVVSPVAATVVAVMVDDPPTLLEPYDTGGVRFESGEFNQAVRVISDSRRTAHYVFDPQLLSMVLELAHVRPRLLWEGQAASVSAELGLIASTDDLVRLERVLVRMIRNASLHH